MATPVGCNWIKLLLCVLHTTASQRHVPYVGCFRKKSNTFRLNLGAHEAQRAHSHFAAASFRLIGACCAMDRPATGEAYEVRELNLPG